MEMYSQEEMDYVKSQIWDKLAEPFSPEQERYYPQSISQSNSSAIAAWYIDARAAAERLDDVVGPGNWEFRIKNIDGISAAECIHGTLSIRVSHSDGTFEWVSKEDVGYRNAKSDEEPIKSAVSDALKRCGAQWGIGRYIYRIPLKWFKCEIENGKFKKWTEKPSHPPVRLKISSTTAVPTTTPTRPLAPVAPEKPVIQPTKPVAPVKPTVDPVAELKASFNRGKTRASAYPIDMSKYEIDEQVTEVKLKKLYSDLTKELTEYEILKDSDETWQTWLETRAKAVELEITVPPENTFKLPMPRDTVVSAIGSVNTVISSKENKE